MMRVINAAAVAVTLMLAFGLYHVTYETQAERRDMHRLAGDLERERDAIRVLEAEWSLLNEPKYLQRLVQERTELEPLQPAQIVTMADLPARRAAVPHAVPRAADGVPAGGSAAEEGIQP